mgnify:CR=1 FL=1
MEKVFYRGMPYPNQETKDLDLEYVGVKEFTIAIDDPEPDYKFNEGELLREFSEYVKATYDAHYSKEKFQATEFIIDGGHGTGFNIGNGMKYLQRYGKKGSHKDARKDLLKVMHYTLIQLFVHDQLHSGKHEETESSDHSSDNSND